ncbi:MAG: iron-sulfur cluster insertion protein ErpA [Acidobacteriota bacterium]
MDQTSQSTSDHAPPDPGALVTLTDAAIEKVKSFAGSNPDFAGKTFRVFIEGGGCSGFQYGFTFDDEREGDTRMRFEDVDVVVDMQSSMYLNGSVVDFVEDLRGAGFVVKNPNASGTCGCGHSFSV